MAWPDRLLRAFGLQRVPQKRGSYVGAAINRLTLDWIRSSLSADKELEGDLLRLRARGRDLARNDGYGRRFVKMAQNHIVGPRGIRLVPCNAMVNGKPRNDLNDAVKAAWERWSKPQFCSLTGKHSLTSMARLMVAEWVTGGEGLTQIVLDRSLPFGIALQPIDADRLDQDLNRPAGEGRNEIRYGVEISRIGRPIAYHILRSHPSELQRYPGLARSYDVIPADQVIHLALWEERVDLTRAPSQYAVVMRDLKHLDGAQEASVIALRAAASTMGFVTTKGDAADVETPDTDQEFESDPGVVKYLGLNQEFQSWDATQPTDNYPDFTKAVLRKLAAGLGVSYSALANDLSDANYSSMRVGRAEEQEQWMALQQWFIDHWMERVFDAWINAAVLAGALSIPNYDVQKASAHKWQPRRWVSVDPVKDVTAFEKELALGVNSRTRYTAGRGDDLWDIWDELEEEEDYAEEKDLDVAPPRQPATGGTTNDSTSDGKGDGADDAPEDAAGDAAGTGRGRTRQPRRGRQPDPDLALIRTAG